MLEKKITKVRISFLTSQQRKKNSKEYVIEPFEKYIGVEKKKLVLKGKMLLLILGHKTKKSLLGLIVSS